MTYKSNLRLLSLALTNLSICLILLNWLVAPKIDVLAQPEPPDEFLNAIYYDTNDVNAVFDHWFPYLSLDLPDPNDCTQHYDGTECTDNPPNGFGYDRHDGIDYGLNYEIVLAAADGTVYGAGWADPSDHTSGLGLFARIEHDDENNYITEYGHLSVLQVQTGDLIVANPDNRQGIIGISGNTGNSTGPHLHFGLINPNGVRVNPYGWRGIPGQDPWELDLRGAVSHDVWIDEPSISTDQFDDGDEIVEPAVNNARMIIDDASADFTHYLQQPHEGESGLPPIPPECGQIVPNEDAYNGSYRQISANTFPMCQSYWHIRPDAFTPPGAYDVFVHIPPGDNKSLGAEYTVRHNGRYLLIQYNCEAALFAVLQNVQTGKETTLARGYFLDWSPDGEWLLFRQTDEDAIWLVQVTTGSRQTLLNLPPGVYNAAFRFDGQTVVTASSHGLGFGSELGGYNLAASAYTPWQTFPQQVIAYPRWSPDGTKLAYILMPDSNQPFTEGELWLADPTTGAPSQKLDSVDAGHGYSPEWSPDGRSLAYVRRENPDSVRANHIATALHSNVYLADAASGQTTPLTTFPDSLVYDITWSPDGAQMAFTADDAIWLMQPGQTPVQLTQNETARHPAWIVENN